MTRNERQKTHLTAPLVAGCAISACGGAYDAGDEVTDLSSLVSAGDVVIEDTIDADFALIYEEITGSSRVSIQRQGSYCPTTSRSMGME